MHQTVWIISWQHGRSKSNLTLWARNCEWSCCSWLLRMRHLLWSLFYMLPAWLILHNCKWCTYAIHLKGWSRVSYWCSLLYLPIAVAFTHWKLCQRWAWMILNTGINVIIWTCNTVSLMPSINLCNTHAGSFSKINQPNLLPGWTNPMTYNASHMTPVAFDWSL